MSKKGNASVNVFLLLLQTDLRTISEQKLCPMLPYVYGKDIISLMSIKTPYSKDTMTR